MRDEWRPRRLLPPPIWNWTDDTAMALSIVEALTDHGDIAPDDLAHRYARRYAHEPNRGYGSGAHRILEALCAGMHWKEASMLPFRGQGSMGNGGAMRAGPIGAYFADNPQEVVRQAMASALPTHGHPEGQAGAVAVAIAASAVWRKRNPRAHEEIPLGLLGMVWDELMRWTPPGPTHDRLEQLWKFKDAPIEEAAEALGDGTSMTSADTVPLSLLIALRHPFDFEEAMWESVAIMGDIDTRAAIVGSIVGLTAEIPPAFLAAREALPDAAARKNNCA